MGKYAINKLGEAQIQAFIKKAKAGTADKTKLADGGGMYLTLTAAGTPVWRLKYRLDGEERTYTKRVLLPSHQGLDSGLYFDNSRNMEMTEAVDALAALAQETRLKVYRLLVEAGPEGLSAGRISEELELPPATLSFHLAHLARAGLAQSRQDGRFVIYSADFQNMNALVGYLTENCCGGQTCAPSCAPASSKGRANETVSRSRRRA